MATEQAPEAGATREDRYRLLVDSILDYAIYMLDPQGRVASWNRGAQRFKGYTAEEIIGQHFSRFYTEEDRATDLPGRALKIAETEGRFEQEGWRVRKDGSLMWAHVLIDPIRSEDGTLVGYAKVTRDMSERKAAQDALNQSEQRFRLLVQGVQDYAIYMLDPGGRVASWNRGAQRFKGYTDEEIIGQHFSRFYTEEDRATDLPGRALKIAETEGRFEQEGWRVRKDGSLMWAHVLIDPIRSEDGTLVGYAKVTRDMSERKAAQDALNQSEQRFRLLVQGVQDYAIYMLDPGGRVASWNRGAQRFKGYTDEEIIGQHFSRFYTEEDRATDLPGRALKIAETEGRFEQEGWRVRKDGSLMWAHVLIDPIRSEDGTLVGYAKVTRDMSERKAAQDALNQSEQRFRLLVQGVQDYAIYMLDPGGRVASWNRGAQRFKGYTDEEIIGQHFSRFYTEEDRATDLPGRALKIAETEGRFEQEGWRVRKDGSLMWAHVLIDPIRSEDGTLVGYAKVTRDMSERKAAQDALNQSEQRFRLLVQGVQDYAIYMLDPGGRVASWNRGAQRFKGYTDEEIIGQHFSRFYTEEDRATDLPGRALKIAETEGRFEQEGWRVRKDGSLMWAHVLIDPIRSEDGTLVGYAKVTRDMSERKAAQDALNQSEQRFRLLVQGVQDYAIYMLDPGGRVASWNRGAQRFKGYTDEEIIGQHFSR
ncbi:PAS domain-containing protein, partial [Methylobacterium segetis]|uniref:PAS domain-containing protein n=1 Tax=Methylobacterium segetis TaxID=2488750 RepID=UPI0014050371